jgi:hypothetical protein
MGIIEKVRGFANILLIWGKHLIVKIAMGKTSDKNHLKQYLINLSLHWLKGTFSPENPISGFRSRCSRKPIR